MDLVTNKKIWSRNFWLSKLLRLLIIGLLGVLLTQLWNWESQQDTKEPATNATNTTQTETKVEEKPVVPVFPYTITLPAGSSEPVEATTAGLRSYTYALVDGASLVVYPDGAPEGSTDVTWRHTVGDDGAVTVGNIPTSLCALGTTGCSAGNGVIDITSRPADGQTDKIVVVIADNNITAKTFEQAQTQYVDIIQTIKVAK